MPDPTVTPLRMPKHLRMALVAPSGWGKTVFSGTAPNALFLTTDPEGTASAAAFGSTAQEIEIHNQDELIDAYLWLERDDFANARKFDFIVTDNLTEVQRIFMARAMEVAVREGKAKGQVRNPYIPGQPEYLTEQNAIIDFVKKMSSLPVHQIFTIHRVGMEDGDGNDFFSAAIRGKAGEIAQLVLGYMNIVGMGDVVTIDEKQIRRLYFEHIRQFRGKDRFTKLGKIQDNLTVPKMMSLIYPDGPVTEGTEPTPTARPRPRKRQA